jgi:hypothetical protein
MFGRDSCFERYSPSARRSHLRHDLLQMGERGKWRLNYARNVNKPIPVLLAITTKKVNAPRRLVPMRLLKLVRSHQKTRKMDVRCHPKQLSAPCDKGVRKITTYPKFIDGNATRCPHPGGSKQSALDALGKSTLFLSLLLTGVNCT